MQDLTTQPAPAQQTGSASADEARAIAKDAYIYGFPLVDHYRIMHTFFEDAGGPHYKGPWNTIINTPRVFGADDTTIQTANSDTPYSHIGLDLRAEPQVVTVPPVEEGRYFCVQLIDGYTHNFDYIGTRTTGNGGGSFLVTGPDWNGDLPAGITKVFRCETNLLYAFFRTQLFNPADLENVKAVQAGYKVEPLSSFLGIPPVTRQDLHAITPLSAEEQKSSIEFFNILNFVLSLCPTHPSEIEVRARFAKIGLNGEDRFDARKLSAEVQAALVQGIADAWKEFGDFKRDMVDTGKLGSADVFGTREYLQNNYLYRMAGAVLGIYGNTAAEAIYPYLTTDTDGQMLDGANKYTLQFAPGQLPPAQAFWSLTMYKLPEILMVHNPLDRYLLNSTMLDQFVRDPDGGLTIFIQADSPGPDKEPNWLPAPTGPFLTVMRLYIPKPEALDGRWQAPRPAKVS